MEHHYVNHVLRMPLDKWPNSITRTFKHLNPEVYVYMQGPSEFGITGGATLEDWNRSKDLPQINVPTLTIGGTHDTMDPRHMEWMAGEVHKGRYLHCQNGSHLAQYDDQKTYINGLIKFLRDVDEDKL